jgi:hypothetical protein
MKIYDEKKANCQHFVEEAIYFLGLSDSLTFGGQMAEFLKNVKEFGKSELKYKISKDLLEISKIKVLSDTIQFKTHKELDKFVSDINKGISNNDKYKNEKELKNIKEFKDDYLVNYYLTISY